MSPSESFPLSVEVRDPQRGRMSRDAEITVLDGHDEVRGRGTGRVKLDLPPGLYAIQVERAGTREEHIRRHSGRTKVELYEPMRFSAVPASDTATSHEYYQAPAIQWSREPTAPPLPADPNPKGSLFIFVRAPSAEAGARPLEEVGLRIADYSGRELAVLDAATTARDEPDGWLAFHAAAPAGPYMLRYVPPDAASSPARDMAITVVRGWQTQIFMTLANGPSFASASVLMGRKGFHPDDRVAQAVDAALAGLQNGTDLLVPEQRSLLLYGKFVNPMLGLVGAHALFRSADLERRTSDTILTNLSRLLGPDEPDVRALRVMAARRFGTPVDAQPVLRPPMLRAGLEALLEAAAETPELVPPGGLLGDIAPQRYVDSPWSTWQPLTSMSGLFESLMPGPEAGAEWVSQYVHDAALQAARSGRPLDVATLAARASLPQSSVAAVYEDLRRTMESGMERTIAMERVIADSRREAKELDIDRDEARTLFFDGGEGDRIRALGLMQGDASLRDFAVVLAGVRESKSAFEQYHALKLGQQMAPKLDDDQRRELAGAIAEQRAPGAHIEPGSDRWYVSRQLLADLGAGEQLG